MNASAEFMRDDEYSIGAQGGNPAVPGKPIMAPRAAFVMHAMSVCVWMSVSARLLPTRDIASGGTWKSVLFISDASTAGGCFCCLSGEEGGRR